MKASLGEVTIYLLEISLAFHLLQDSNGQEDTRDILTDHPCPFFLHRDFQQGKGTTADTILSDSSTLSSKLLLCQLCLLHTHDQSCIAGSLPSFFP